MISNDQVKELNEAFRQATLYADDFLANIGGKVNNVDEFKRQIITKTIPDILGQVFDPNQYVIKGSVGAGRQTTTPWVAIMDKQITTSTQKGVFIVFLFRSDMKGVYISLGQGTTVEGNFGFRSGTKDIAKRTIELRSLLMLNNPNLGTDNESVKVSDNKYKTSLIYAKEWDFTRIEGKDEILQAFIMAYDTYKAKAFSNDSDSSNDNLPDETEDDPKSFDMDLFDDLIAKFKKIHPVKPFAGCDELYKWQLITMCQGLSNIEIAKTISKKHKNLLAIYDVSTLSKIIIGTEEGQNDFGRILDNLFDESKPITDRLIEFKKAQNSIWPKATNLPDDNRSASVFLTCKYPDKYAFSTWSGVYRKLCKYLGEKEKTDSIFLPHFIAMLLPLQQKVSQDEELKQMIKDSTPDCIQSDLLTAQTIVYTMLCGGSSNEGTESGIPEKKIENDNNPQKPAAPIIGTNVIFYGAPGTGKSYHIDHDVIRACKSYKRTTFHPDTDYSAFVGCYKPTRDKATEKITYKFVSQVFVKAYVQAWHNRAKEMYLIIEEINRGNCAQIFGDIFQLLDRNEEGWSSYDIEPDCDLQDCLAEEFSKNGNKIDTRNLPSRVIDIISKIESGEKMLLPNNLFLWATMNTSDQSLFPIDSAFKRRWDWKYRPIAKGKDQETGKDITRTISVGSGYDWWEFLQEINTAIFDVTNSEDKQLGFWFVKPDTEGNRISCNLFVEKVLFYLWSDVFKDYSEGSPFKFGNATHPFVHFINEDETVKEDLAEKFLKNLFKEKDSVQGIPEEGESTVPINA